MAPRVPHLAALLALVVVAILAACGGGKHANARHDVSQVRSPCRGIDPWTGAALRRCMALVSRWAPVHSVPLTTQLAPRVRSTCKEARRESRIPVVCPPLIPAGGVIADPGLYGFEGPPLSDKAGDFYLLTFNNGDNPGRIHWIVGAGRGESVQRNLFNSRVWEVPGRIRRLAGERYGPWRIAFYRFPPYPSGGPLGGHDLALVRRGGMTYFASIHGWGHHDAGAAMLLAILLTVGAPR